MNNLVPGAVVAALVAVACGGGGKTQPLDAGVDQLICDPTAQTRCKADEKCTWVVDANATAKTGPVGHVDCVAVDPNAVARGMACTPAAAGVSGGADNCARGDICISAVCKQICDLQLTSGTGACDATHACLSYVDVFETPNAPIAGACEVACDPLTQKLATSHAEACGSVDPTMPDGTCVPTTGDFKSFACAQTLMGTEQLTDRKPPLGDARSFFGNGCAPGFVPFFFENGDAGVKTLCSGMCAPVKMDSTIYAAGKAANPDLNAGDPNALGKLPGDPEAVAGHATCQLGVKGSLTQAEGTEDCRYIWAPLAIAANPQNPTLVDTPYNNILGMCFAYSRFITVDTNNDQKADAPEKSCRELGTEKDDIYGTAKQNGCYPADLPGATTPTTPWAFQPNPHGNGRFRLAYGAGAVARPVLE
jgi:hypothetical protein